MFSLNFKRIFLFSIFLIVAIGMFWPTCLHAEDDNGLDFTSDDTSASKYEGINGYYEEFDFFSDANISIIKNNQNSKKEEFTKRQVDILNHKLVKKDYSYFNDSLFDSTISTYSTNKQESKDTNEGLIMMFYIISGGASILVLLVIYLHYHNKMKNEVLDYETNNYYQ